MRLPTALGAIALLALTGLASCETVTKTDPTTGAVTATKVTTAKTQDDVKWACYGLKGASVVYAAAAPLEPSLPQPASTLVIAVNAGISGICDHQDKLTNLDDAYQRLMGLTGELSAALAKAGT